MTLEIISDPALDGARHGFFTRKGGASSGVFAGLNCGFGSSDQQDIVAINRDRVAGALSLPSTHLVGVHQVHSADVVTVEKAGPILRKADGLVTRHKDIGLSVLTADCQPVLFMDATAGVIGAAHAGWKGALTGVLEQTVRAMEQLGALRQNVAAVIGPSISQANYEVGGEFRDRFMAVDPGYDRFFVAGAQSRFHFDLPGFGLMRLRSFGVGQAHWTRHCTYADPVRFFSYRRSVHRKEADYGRLIAAIRL
ncbi:MAG: peptidoglycan editing factor PgeF [Loktanella sp.]|nr:peptidoglycan editing factor PgeF [Loktanella sp.]